MAELINTFLKKQGLNEKDIAIYLDVFRHGQSFASSIGLRTKIDRTTVYSVLKRLLKHGFLAQSVVNDVAVYIAVSPEIFVRNIDSEMQDLMMQKNVAQAFVQEMSNLEKRSFVKPKTRVYEGDRAIINLYEETLQNPGEQKAFVNLRPIPSIVQDFLRGSFIKSKVAHRVFSKVIVTDGPITPKYMALDHKSNRETRVIRNLPFDLQTEIILFNKKEVAIIDFNNPVYGIVFESSAFYKTMEALFDYLWRGSERN